MKTKNDRGGRQDATMDMDENVSIKPNKIVPIFNLPCHFLTRSP